MPWIMESNNVCCPGCNGLKGSWQSIYDEAKKFPRTKWIKCGICSGDGYITTYSEVWISKQELRKRNNE